MECKFRNVNDAFDGLVRGMHQGHIRTEVEPSRYGEVIRIPEPVLLHYACPKERVLFNQARDANPFALLYESLWMLTGRNDVEPLAYYTKRFREFSDDGETLNDAYGYRWRHAVCGCDGQANRYETYDQLQRIIHHLKHNPHSRRAVLQMWNVEDDLLKIGTPVITPDHVTVHINNYSKAVCCNLSVMFEVEMGYSNVLGFVQHDVPKYLNMTVTNRSNDLVWGLLGANYVTFSILQEYMAAHLGLEAGWYCHFTNNLHAYTNNWKPEKWIGVAGDVNMYRCVTSGISPHPLVRDPKMFDYEVIEFVERHSKDAFGSEYEEPFLRNVAQPMCCAYHQYKRGDYKQALTTVASVRSEDWRIAGTSWIQRRIERKQNKEVGYDR